MGAVSSSTRGIMGSTSVVRREPGSQRDEGGRVFARPAPAFRRREKGKMVGVARIELATPAMSTQCSTTELHAHCDGYLVKPSPGRNPTLREGVDRPVDVAGKLGRGPARHRR